MFVEKILQVSQRCTKVALIRGEKILEPKKKNEKGKGMRQTSGQFIA